MASEFSKTLVAELTAHVPPDIVAWGEHVIDGSLQETRAVLIQTADRNILPHGPCWCRKDLTNDNELHNEFCLRARALWAKLEVK